MSVEPTSGAQGTPHNSMSEGHASPGDYKQALHTFRGHLAETSRYDDPQYLTEVASTIQSLHESTANAPDEDTQILHTILTQHIDVDGEKISLHQASKEHAKLGPMLQQFDRYPMAKERLIEELGYF
ncbi:MAG: hypothetical protein SP1CHLAM54_17160 [Chlamydiia bacterium]|nr:hypothetical protein [Chlamydiia bacterium]MCH9616604.1 hypothetical protein [Chlamydiia bacterium]MCH9629334.1 hypothetical protein [Chlamydiia bacterium]